MPVPRGSGSGGGGEPRAGERLHFFTFLLQCADSSRTPPGESRVFKGREGLPLFSVKRCHVLAISGPAVPLWSLELSPCHAGGCWSWRAQSTEQTAALPPHQAHPVWPVAL